ncbi:MAG TPA: tryptophan--tRNA ligase [Candidatus Peribacter riflensis]|uniref:Tryptophan--tRNA ligase n=1 Tax=Candidatus Peribacter riflensis TaxID=1735162 RepID=A0A0S1SWW4_9BACT|nr:MAG: tryptophanyl-tRNA synthetase [Candidatus Peribacter riflensis]OGJ79004.1 MAG: tryptophan--tRNA ligase [Candidatus Peribacteria bacterium RIFOXYB1_FULL_57_12]OGJ80192.1 MAG: tryptophan--tRNA ligase [Candidatus Peribacteria bacterium RIFOXYC1_FULL_58_8]ALM11153.1 MAG: tryptophanyl-tRNA synthetase [Candidatus Peribacter riflensis]ALM12256.1 MAG: tryptophanyl-tRNA synthetase [Candidatus Peribacter riflensis]
MRVLSGIQPSGQLHLGNYFGSIKPNLEWAQKSDESFFFIADLHALTTMQDAEKLKQAREDIVLDYLACGFDPEKAVIFEQSKIPEHTELLWILSTVTPMGLLERAVSYKDKVSQGIAASAGLFTYPVLMAADILLYQTNVVPVGRDQKQHVEIARDIATKFNRTFDEVFTLPEPHIRAEVATVPGTDGRKMSKSYGNTIPLFAEESQVKKAIMGIQTDSKGMTDPKDPDTCPIFQIHRLFLGKKEAEALAGEYRAGLSYADGKKRLLQAFMDVFGPLRTRRAALKPREIAAVLEQGNARARVIAAETMQRVRKAVGLL